MAVLLLAVSACSSGTEIAEPVATTTTAPDVAVPLGEQALMGRVGDGFSESSQIADIVGSIVCTNVGTTTEKNIDEAAQLAGVDITLFGFVTSDEANAAFIAGGCDLVTDDYSTLVNLRERQQPTDQQWVLFSLGLNPSSASTSTSTTKARIATTRAPTTTKPALTTGERNAREMAADYLDYSSFSRSGLIDQLKYEGFTTAQAEYGVDAQGANWNAQAALMAADYLDYSSFSRSGLIDQLKYEGFTTSQAEYGVNAVGY